MVQNISLKKMPLEWASFYSIAIYIRSSPCMQMDVSNNSYSLLYGKGTAVKTSCVEIPSIIWYFDITVMYCKFFFRILWAIFLIKYHTLILQTFFLKLPVPYRYLLYKFQICSISMSENVDTKSLRVIILFENRKL